MFENNSKKTYTLDDYPVTYIKIGDGFTAIDNTVKKMIEVINESAKNIRIRSKASDIIKDVPERDKYGECDAIYNWTRDNSRYTKDIDGEETLQSPIMALDLIDKGSSISGRLRRLYHVMPFVIKKYRLPRGYKNCRIWKR